MTSQNNIISPQEIPDEKICTRCKILRPHVDYHKDRSGKYGLRSVCKQCSNSRAKAWYEKNRERCKAVMHNYRKTNRDEISAKKREYLESNREALNAASRGYYRANRDGLCAKIRKYQSENPEQRRAQDAVKYATKTGKLNRPQNCSKCELSCKPEAHHPSYLPEHRLDVVWLCKSCHKQLHAELRIKRQNRKDGE